MADGIIAAHPVHNLAAVKIARNMPHGAVGVKLAAVKAGDPRRFLSAMLQCVQAKRDQRGSIIAASHPKHTAFFAQFVIVKRMRCDHDSLQGNASGAVRCDSGLGALIEALAANVSPRSSQFVSIL
jgi:hypothetical protein